MANSNSAVMTWLMSSLTPSTALASFLLLLVGIAIRRLYFSPISHIPGPKLAAITQLYEAYYDVYLDGQFTLHLQSLHEKYGKRTLPGVGTPY